MEIAADPVVLAPPGATISRRIGLYRDVVRLMAAAVAPGAPPAHMTALAETLRHGTQDARDLVRHLAFHAFVLRILDAHDVDPRASATLAAFRWLVQDHAPNARAFAADGGWETLLEFFGAHGGFDAFCGVVTAAVGAAATADARTVLWRSRCCYATWSGRK